MTEAEIRAEMRLLAIEQSLCELWAKYYLNIGASVEQVEQSHEAKIESLKTETIPGLDAASSDLAAAELEAAVTSLLTLQREMLKSARVPKGQASSAPQ